ncbi:Uncharacterised protein [Vibrio cholerae]|nr:Uncharacterised protein [Vibrio cholerae]
MIALRKWALGSIGETVSTMIRPSVKLTSERLR